ncbi:hypothetical protein EJA72_11040 [Pseudomonas sp. PB120]|nr:hypothetical protein [Pseudomonas sp. PB120]
MTLCFIGDSAKLGFISVHCGSEPARDEGLTVNIKVECQIAIASRLAPTGISNSPSNGGLPHHFISTMTSSFHF